MAEMLAILSLSFLLQPSFGESSTTLVAGPRIFGSTVGDVIESVPFLPITINVPDVISGMANLVSGVIPFLNQQQGSSKPRKPKRKPPKHPPAHPVKKRPQNSKIPEKKKPTKASPTKKKPPKVQPPKKKGPTRPGMKPVRKTPTKKKPAKTPTGPKTKPHASQKKTPKPNWTAKNPSKSNKAKTDL